MIETAVRFFQEGGFFMYPIAIVLIIGLIVAAERYIYLSAQKITNRRGFWKSCPASRSVPSICPRWPTFPR